MPTRHELITKIFLALLSNPHETAGTPHSELIDRAVVIADQLGERLAKEPEEQVDVEDE